MPDIVSPDTEAVRNPRRSLRISIHIQLLVTFAVVITLAFGVIYFAARHSLTRHALAI